MYQAGRDRFCLAQLTYRLARVLYGPAHEESIEKTLQSSSAASIHTQAHPVAWPGKLLCVLEYLRGAGSCSVTAPSQGFDLNLRF